MGEIFISNMARDQLGVKYRTQNFTLYCKSTFKPSWKCYYWQNQTNIKFSQFLNRILFNRHILCGKHRCKEPGVCRSYTSVGRFRRTNSKIRRHPGNGLANRYATATRCRSGLLLLVCNLSMSRLGIGGGAERLRSNLTISEVILKWLIKLPKSGPILIFDLSFKHLFTSSRFNT